MVVRPFARLIAGQLPAPGMPQIEPIERIGEPQDRRRDGRAYPPAREPFGGPGEPSVGIIAAAAARLLRRPWRDIAVCQELDRLAKQLAEIAAETRFRLLLAAPYRVADSTGAIGLARAPVRAVAPARRAPAPLLLG